MGPGLGSLDWSDLAKISIDFLKIDLGITVGILMQSFDENGDLLGTAVNQQMLDPSVIEVTHDFLFAQPPPRRRGPGSSSPAAI